MTVEQIDVSGEDDKKAVEEEAKHEMDDDTDKAMNIVMIFARVLGVLVCLYFFLVGIELMGTAFKVLGGKGAGNMFRDIPNGLAALMVGVLATVMVQSSSTSTSIVVALVSAGQLQVRPAVPIIMGANIGTTITNTICPTYIGKTPLGSPFIRISNLKFDTSQPMNIFTMTMNHDPDEHWFMMVSVPGNM